MIDRSVSVRTAYRPTRDNLEALGLALLYTFVPHARNDPTRKWVTTILFLTWGLVTVIRHLGFSPVDQQVYWFMTVIVLSIITHLWGFEYGVLASLVSGERESEGLSRPDSDDSRKGK